MRGRLGACLVLLGIGIFLAGVCLAGTCLAQRPLPVQWRVSAAPPAVLGEKAAFGVGVTATVAPGWHLYAMEQPEEGLLPTEFSVPAEGVAELLSVHADRPLLGHAGSPGGAAAFYVGQARFLLQLRLRGEAPAGPQEIPVTVRFQACNERMCLPPRTEELPVRVRIGGRRP